MHVESAWEEFTLVQMLLGADPDETCALCALFRRRVCLNRSLSTWHGVILRDRGRGAWKRSAVCTWNAASPPSCPELRGIGSVQRSSRHSAGDSAAAGRSTAG